MLFRSSHWLGGAFTELSVSSQQMLRTLLTGDSAAALGLSSVDMPSGAGHDGQSMKGIAPVGMIFVPSKDGISHAPSEYTSPEQITNGANGLRQTILGMDSLLR